MSTTDTNVQQVVVNKLTKAQYEAATKEPTEFYAVTDEQIGTNDIANGAVTSAKIASGALLDLVYPIGSIYMSATLSTPAQVANALGGTWVAWGAGRVPVGVNANDTDFDTVEETGGSKTHSHDAGTLGADLEFFTANGRTYIDYKPSVVPSYTQSARLFNENGSTESSHSEQSTAGIAINGTSQTASSLQPYITCYMYKRTA